MTERTKVLWSRGNYDRVATALESGAVQLVRACEIGPGSQVLDVAAGTGNLAVHAALAGAGVVACDLTPAMIDKGRARTKAAGLDVEWKQADAEELPFENDRFDCVASAFGVTFAPHPEVAVAEMFRVAKPGASVGMANWDLRGVASEFRETMIKHLACPMEIPWPVGWGDETFVRSRLNHLSSSIQFSRSQVRFVFDSLEEFRAFALKDVGAILAATEALPPDRYQALVDEIDQFGASYINRDGVVVYEQEYLLVIAQKRA